MSLKGGLRRVVIRHLRMLGIVGFSFPKYDARLAPGSRKRHLPRAELLRLPSAGVRMYVYLPRVDRDVTTSGDFSLVRDGDSDSMICYSGTSRNRLHKLYISFQTVAHPRLQLPPDTPIEPWVLRLIFDKQNDSEMTSSDQAIARARWPRS